MQEPEERVTELFRRHANDIHAYAAWRVGPHDAPDVVGEVFLIVWRRLGVIRAGEERGWLFGVARKVVLSRLRQGAATVALVEQVVIHAPADSEPDGFADHIALSDQVRRTLNVLSDRDREVLVAATWFDLTPAEAAQALGVTRPTYLVRLHRARHRFRVAFQQIAGVGDGASTTHRSPLAV
jgi:RNA polymerase sigma factor (sigma-70 family)